MFFSSYDLGIKCSQVFVGENNDINKMIMMMIMMMIFMVHLQCATNYADPLQE